MSENLYGIQIPILTSNSTAAIMRIGMAEMKKFSEHFFEGIKQQTWIESCGMADIITTCEYTIFPMSVVHESRSPPHGQVMEVAIASVPKRL